MADRMKREWAHVFASGAVGVAGGSQRAIDLLSGYKGEVGVTELRGVTIGTVIGQIGVSEAVLATSQPVIMGRLAMGIGVFPEALGAAVVPIPGNQTYPWMWYWERVFYFENREGAAGVFFRVSFNIDLHIRAMRKMRMNEELQLRINNLSSVEMDIGMGGNCLLLR